MDIDLLIVGPAGHSTGGVSRYVTEQRRRLPASIGVSVYDIGVPKDRSPLGFLGAVLRSMGDLVAFPFRSRPDLVHVHSSHGFGFYRASLYLLFVAHLWRRPVVLHVHGSSFDDFVETENPALRTLQDLVFASSGTIIVLSEYWKRALAERVPEDKLTVAPNAVDASEYDPSFETAVPVVAFVSNHVERKGINELVTAIDRLMRSDAPAFRARIAGAGPESWRVERLAERYDDVDYLGYVSEAEKRALLGDASIYVLPAHAEGLPIALLEGMAGGNAVVATEVGSIPEVVGEENGHLVRPGDADQLTDALSDLIERPDDVEAMGRTNHRLVRDEYSWPNVSERLTKVYRSLAR